MKRASQYSTLAAKLGTLTAVRAVVDQRRGHPIRFDSSVGPLRMPAEPASRYHLMHSVDKLERLARYVTDGDVVFDIGAHVGVFAALAAKRAGKVVAVEPDATLHPLIASNAPSAVRVEAAVAGETGHATLWRVAKSTQVSSLDRASAEEFADAVPVKVATVTLTELAGNHGQPDVIKLDVQGQEWPILQEGWEVAREARVLLVEATLLDRQVDRLLSRLRGEFGDPELVNDVYAGADLAYVR